MNKQKALSTKIKDFEKVKLCIIKKQTSISSWWKLSGSFPIIRANLLLPRSYSSTLLLNNIK